MPLQKRITPFLWFDHEGEEAAKFYCDIFPNSKITTITRYSDAGPGPKGAVMTVEFELDGQNLVALNGGPIYKLTEAFSLAIRCESQQEIDYYWERLLAGGGEESQCGWLKDRFGLSWQVVPEQLIRYIADPNPKKVAAVMSAFMPMRKFDLATLQKAYEKA